MSFQCCWLTFIVSNLRFFTKSVFDRLAANTFAITKDCSVLEQRLSTRKDLYSTAKFSGEGRWQLAH